MQADEMEARAHKSLKKLAVHAKKNYKVKQQSQKADLTFSRSICFTWI
jgi:hypothetical protein